MKSDRTRHKIEQEFYPDGQMKRHYEVKEPVYNDFLINFVCGILAIAITSTCFVIILQMKNYEQHNRFIKSSSNTIERGQERPRLQGERSLDPNLGLLKATCNIDEVLSSWELLK